MSRVDRSCLAALATMSLAPTLTMVIWSVASQPPLTIMTIALTSVLLACTLGAVTRVWRYFFLAQLPIGWLSLAFAAYTIGFNMPPGSTLAQLLAGASWEEFRGFIGMSVGSWMALSLVGWTVCYVLLCLKLPRSSIFNGSTGRLSRMLVYSAAAGAAYCVTNPGQMAVGLTLNPAVGSVLFLAGDIPRARAELRGSDVDKTPYRAHTGSVGEVHILVIGESTRRESWSTYGYGRPTTPCLDALRDDVVLLKNAVADANLTSWSVPIILTGMSPEKFSLQHVKGNLLDLAKEGGFSTAWLANQDLNIARSVGIDPDSFVLASDSRANIFGRGALDGSLLPSYRREVNRSSRSRFVAVHMMGTHWEYFRRYPSDFEQFGSGDALRRLSSGSLFLKGPATSSALVDAYDNATLYADWFLRQLIDAASGLTVPATLTFFPDHGEDLQQLDGSTGHGLPVYTRHAFEVPAFVWVNEAFRQAHPAMFAAMKANAAKEIRSHDVFYTEAELMGITWPGMDTRRSFASPDFSPDGTTKHYAGGVPVMRQ